MIVEAGPLYAYVDADDSHHEASIELLETHPGPLVVPTLVITEVAYLLAERLSITDVATLDRRHFTVVRPQHVTAFTLLP